VEGADGGAPKSPSMTPKMVAVALALIGAVGSMAAEAAPPGGVVVSHFYTFAPGDRLEELDVEGPPAPLVQGTELWFANLDGAPHSVTAVGRSDGIPLFDSGVLGLGEAAPVTGTGSLTPGDYLFVCSVHPFLMQGTLRVIGP